MNLLSTDTKEIQSRLANYCRTGEKTDLPGVTPNRIHHYRRLVYNIIQDNLQSSFPIAFKYLPREDWKKMLQDFFANHPCQSYQVWQIPGEFYQYALTSNFAEKFQLPYLYDLLKFEWEEIVIYSMGDIELSDYTTKGEPLNDKLYINPEHKILQLQFPIHLFNPEVAKEKKGQYYVLLFRDQEKGSVQFMDLSVWFALVIEQIGKGNLTLKELLDESPNIFQKTNLEQLTKTTLSFIEHLIQKGFVLGYKK